MKLTILILGYHKKPLDVNVLLPVKKTTGVRH